MWLDRFTSSSFDRGAPLWKEVLWVVVGGLMLSSWLPGSGWRRSLLVTFGAQIGRSVVLKPGLRVKFPWRLSIGDNTWIGEDVWIDNLAEVTVGAHTCLSQAAYLCTGSHDWGKDTFDLITCAITIGDHAWLGAQASLAPGSVMEDGAVLAMAGFGNGRLAAWTIHAGNPATPQRARPKSDGA